MALGISRLPLSLRNRLLGGSFFSQFGTPAAAFSLRDLSGAGENVVKVRRSLDDAERDFTAVDITNGTLAAWVNGASSADTLPADFGSGAAAAYSLRYVAAAYSGDVVNVRRSSDDAERSFNPTEVEDGTLTAWVGAASDGHVVTLYDQSGNSNDATQVAAANQPLIVDAGVLVTENGKPAMQFNDTTTKLDLNAGIDLNAGFSVSAVVNVGTSNAYGLLGGNDANTDSVLIYSYQIRAKIDSVNYNVTGGSSITGSQRLINLYRVSNVGDIEADVDGAALTAAAGPAGILTFEVIGTNIGLNSIDGTLQELVIYNSNQNANKLAIESNQNYYFSIFDSSLQGFVHTWYNQGTGADAIQSSGANQPLIVDAGAVILDNGVPAIQGDGSQYLNISVIEVTDDFAVFNLFNGTGLMSGSSSAGGNDYIRFNGSVRFELNGNSYQVSVNRDNIQTLTSFLRDLSDELRVRYNSSEISPSPFTGVDAGGWETKSILAYNSTIIAVGKVQEQIIFNEGKESQFEAIEENINKFYSIF